MLNERFLYQTSDDRGFPDAICAYMTFRPRPSMLIEITRTVSNQQYSNGISPRHSGIRYVVIV